MIGLSDLTAYRLRVGHSEAPLCLDDEVQRFSWRLRSVSGGQRQVAFSIRIEDPHGKPLVDGRDWTHSTDPFIMLQLPTLKSRTEYTWHVRLLDNRGRETAPFMSKFTTGLLNREDFTGEWIARSRHFSENVNPPAADGVGWRAELLPPPSVMRTTFTVNQAPRRAMLYASARGLYRPYLNGARIGDHELTPGWTDYRDHELYQCFDVTEQLQEGLNALAFELAAGWWSGYMGFDPRVPACHYGTDPQLWCRLVVDYPESPAVEIVTSSAWKEASGRRIFSDLIIGERIDEKRDLGAWALPAYDDSGWNPTVVVDDDLTRLRASTEPPVRIVQWIEGKHLGSFQQGHLYDFGQNIVGWSRVDFGPTPPPILAKLRYGEILDEEGSLYTENLRTAEATDYYSGSGTFEPAFTIHGFRYLLISGIETAPDSTNVLAAVVASDMEQTGSATTSNELINKLLQNIMWTQRGNHVTVPTDCPQRDERLGWLGDAQTFLPTAAFNADVLGFYARWLKSVRSGQTSEGSVQDVAPVISTFFVDGAPGWADGAVIIPWALYREYGDIRVLQQSFDSMKAWVDFVHSSNPGLIWAARRGSNYGDWLHLDTRDPERDLLATAFFANSARLVGKAANALDESEAQEHYNSLADQIREAFIARFVTPEGQIGVGSQSDYCLAIYFDLVPEALKPKSARRLVEALYDNGLKLTTGIMTSGMLCPVLTSIGRSDLAYTILESQTYPGWLYSVAQGATTIWERWDGYVEGKGFQTPNMNSFNHYALGAVGAWIHESVCGISQEDSSVGYRELKFAPQPGGTITHASASLETVRGRTEISWTIDQGEFRVRVLVPPGSVAKVHMPGPSGDEQSCIYVESGEHTLTAPWLERS